MTSLEVAPARLVDVTVPPSERFDNKGVQVNPDINAPQGFTFYMSGFADTLPKWGTDVIHRDEKLREFWPTESTLASAMCSQIARYASFPYTLDGPERMTHIYESIFEACENGEGFISMMTKVCHDLYGQDNGGFIELIRTRDDPRSPVISFRHKDAARCRRTGNWDTPVIYWDLENKAHAMRWYQIIPLSEMPSPDETKKGLQVCVLSRILHAAQVIQAINDFMREQVGGLRHHKLHLIGGFNQTLIDDTLKQKLAEAQAAGRAYSIDPVLLAALHPEGRVTHEEIELSSLPDNFDIDNYMKWFIEIIALGWEDEYQSFAPLPGGNLGTATQSQTMADKARSKGPAVFMRLIEHKFNFYGVLPRSIRMRYGSQDVVADQQKIMQLWRYSQILKLLIDSKTITPEVAQLMLRDSGHLKKEYLTLMGQVDPTPQSVDSDNPQADPN